MCVCVCVWRRTLTGPLRLGPQPPAVCGSKDFFWWPLEVLPKNVMQPKRNFLLIRPQYKKKFAIENLSERNIKAKKNQLVLIGCSLMHHWSYSGRVWSANAEVRKEPPNWSLWSRLYIVNGSASIWTKTGLIHSDSMKLHSSGPSPSSIDDTLFISFLFLSCCKFSWSSCDASRLL